MLKDIPSTVEYIESFGGYNADMRIPENEFNNEMNMSAQNYPVLSSCNSREKLYDITTDKAIIGNISLNGLWRIELRYEAVDDKTTQEVLFAVKEIDENNDLEKEYRIGVVTDEPMKRRQIVTMGAYILIYPDNMYINTIKPTDKGESSFEKDCTGSELNINWCIETGKVLDLIVHSATPPTTADNGDYWLDESSIPHILKQYSSPSKLWVPVANPYIAITINDDLSGLKKGDNVQIIVNGAKDKSDELFKILENGVKIEKIIFKKSDLGGVESTKIVTHGRIRESFGYLVPEGAIIRRATPIMDYVCSCNNRVWGCRYGTNKKGDFVNEIYASKLGDFKNWTYYAGTSIDSYTASIGANGEFTGCIAYMNTPMFFKQNTIYRVYGNFPSNYQLQETTANGVKKGANESLKIIDGVLYYCGENSVYAYTGSFPNDIGEKLNNDKLQKANLISAGAYKHKYYLSLYSQIDTGKEFITSGEVLVYDTTKGIWHKEEAMDYPVFREVEIDGESVLVYINNKPEYYTFEFPFPFGGTIEITLPTVIQSVMRITDHTNEDLQWFCESGIICANHEQKVLNKISIRCKIENKVSFYVEYDSSGKWEKVGEIKGRKLRSYEFFIKLKRCDHARLKIEGKGQFDLFSIAKTWQKGGAVCTLESRI